MNCFGNRKKNFYQVNEVNESEDTGGKEIRAKGKKNKDGKEDKDPKQSSDSVAITALQDDAGVTSIPQEDNANGGKHCEKKIDEGKKEKQSKKDSKTAAGESENNGKANDKKKEKKDKKAKKKEENSAEELEKQDKKKDKKSNKKVKSESENKKNDKKNKNSNKEQEKDSEKDKSQTVVESSSHVETVHAPLPPEQPLESVDDQLVDNIVEPEAVTRCSVIQQDCDASEIDPETTTAKELKPETTENEFDTHHVETGPQEVEEEQDANFNFATAYNDHVSDHDDGEFNVEQTIGEDLTLHGVDAFHESLHETPHGKEETSSVQIHDDSSSFVHDHQRTSYTNDETREEDNVDD